MSRHRRAVDAFKNVCIALLPLLKIRVEPVSHHKFGWGRACKKHRIRFSHITFELAFGFSSCYLRPIPRAACCKAMSAKRFQKESVFVNHFVSESHHCALRKARCVLRKLRVAPLRRLWSRWRRVARSGSLPSISACSRASWAREEARRSFTDRSFADRSPRRVRARERER